MSLFFSVYQKKKILYMTFNEKLISNEMHMQIQHDLIKVSTV